MTSKFDPSESLYQPGKVAIIGPGTVGMVLAYTLMLRRTAKEIVLVGRNRKKAEGEATDLMHAQAFLQTPMVIRAGDMETIQDSEVVVVCASEPMPETLSDRNQLAEGNARLMKQLLPDIAHWAPNSKLLLVTNPVDAVTMLALELTGFPKERVIGTGTLVDSIRFRELLSKQLDIHPDDLRAYILGEHGQHQFAAISVAQAGGEKIDDTPERRSLSEVAKQAGIEVFRKKGNTSYAIGQAAAYVVESIIMNERRTIPLSAWIDGFLGVKDVCLSVPVVIGKKGIERYLQPQLNEKETEYFRQAAKAVGSVYEVMKAAMQD